MPTPQCCDVRRVEGPVLRNKDDAPIYLMFLNGLFEAQEESLHELLRNALVPVSRLLCVTVCTVSGRLIRLFGHRRILQKN